MITVRNTSPGPVALGALRLAPGESGAVDENRPGVRLLIESKRLAIVEGDLAIVDAASELAAARAELASLRAERDSLAADVTRLTAMVEALGNGQSKPVESDRADKPSRGKG